MQRALALAAQGLYTTTPNPRVGCVLARADGTLIGEGFHRAAGEPHAEVLALHAAGSQARDATAYVTLEPCSHHGRTPPCADALITAGVARVVVAMQDPDPRVAGSGVARLRAAGIPVDVGLQAGEAASLNPGFISRMTRGRPWVRLKAAISLDGFTALPDGSSQWITGPAARDDGHRWRARACALLTGSGTVRTDDPRLSVRAVQTPRQPLKIIVDGQLHISGEAAILQQTPAWVVHGRLDAAAQQRSAQLAAAGVRCLAVPAASNPKRVDLFALMRRLGENGINELHVEGGQGLNGALLDAGLVDELLIYQAPRLLGRGLGMAQMPGLLQLGEARLTFTPIEVVLVGGDVRLRLVHPASHPILNPAQSLESQPHVPN
jgi:diaminohydroxyphosphoribosylaminopyrimidine deaminase/5-amino-6-(5-phosphoribosylamino)uracil reductase